MTKEQVKAALDRVLTWPPERQEDAVEILKAVEEQDASDLRLSDEQLAVDMRKTVVCKLGALPDKGAWLLPHGPL